MSDHPPEQDTIFRNIRLIATKWNAFVFLVHPFLCYAWMIYTGSQVSNKENVILSTKEHFFFAVIIWPVCAMFLALVTGEEIKERLERDGYVQKRTRAREVDFGINLAVFGAFMYWAQNYEGNGRESAFFTAAAVVFGGVMLWWIIIAMSIGPVLWFTVKVR